MSPLRTLHLIERRPKLCRLAPAEVDFLLLHHRTSFEVLPTARRHVYRVTPAGVAGVVVTPRRRIVVSSKVPLRNLFLLDPLIDVSGERDEVQPANGIEVLDFLAVQLATRMSERSTAGLHRSYRETAARGNYLVGRLDVPAQLREPGRKEQIHSRQDEFTHDVPCNQVPRSLAANLLSSGLLSPTVRERLTGALTSFGEVRETLLTADVLASLQRERLPVEYQPLIDLCRLLIDCLAPAQASGSVPAPAFLLPLERLFERYLTRAVQNAFASETNGRVNVQESYPVGEPATGQPEVRIRPDVAIDREGRVLLVVDAKWKRLPATAVVTEDLYQMLAYCTVLGASGAVLVYPGRRRRVWEYVLPHAGARVQVRTLDVAGTADQCAKARRRLGRDLRRLLRE